MNIGPQILDGFERLQLNAPSNHSDEATAVKSPAAGFTVSRMLMHRETRSNAGYHQTNDILKA
jgi:hypothetical protein